VAGDQPVPPPRFESELRRRLTELAGPDPLFKVVRFDGSRGLVRVGHRSVPAARQAWNALGGSPGAALPLHTARSYGTLRKGKAWMRSPGRRTVGGADAPDRAYK